MRVHAADAEDNNKPRRKQSARLSKDNKLGALIDRVTVENRKRGMKEKTAENVQVRGIHAAIVDSAYKRSSPRIP